MSGIAKKKKEQIFRHDEKYLTQRSVPIHKISLVTNNERRGKFRKMRGMEGKQT
jgi:hypothetical protein